MYILFSFVAGLVFGFGLIVSQMVSPVKVLGFLDVFGRWDPSLLLVMAAAVVVTMIGFALSRKRTSTLLGTPMHMPTARDIDRRLIGGSVVFGIGWGLAGFCPGPALVALGTGHVKAFIFVIAMLAGMGIFELVERKRGRVSLHPAPAVPVARAHAADALHAHKRARKGG